MTSTTPSPRLLLAGIVYAITTMSSSLLLLPATSAFTAAFTSVAVRRSAPSFRSFRTTPSLWSASNDSIESKGSASAPAVDYSGVSRVSTLQTLLAKRGAPGSRGCTSPGDLTAITAVDLLAASSSFADVHPHLLPLARSASTGNLVCALRRPFATDEPQYENTSVGQPWPVVESSITQPGMRLLSLNSEHFMRRIAAEADDDEDVDAKEEVTSLYNEGLGKGELTGAFSSLDEPWVPGAVADLGYGAEKYCLLRVGPFPDLYQSMSRQHLGRGDEKSSLIAAETCNGKFGGFGSTFAFYAKLLSELPKRGEEARDAARMCLRMPVPSMGLSREDMAVVAGTAKLFDGDGEDSDAENVDAAMAKLLEFYEKIRDHEEEDNKGDKTPQQAATDDANYILDVACLTGRKYGEVREEIAEIYRKVGMDDAADFVSLFSK